MPTHRKAITMLTDQQLARLFVHLQVPVAVQALLDDPRTFDDDTHLALSDMISSQTPDQALLSIALSSLLLDARMREDGQRSAEILAMSAEMMVQDYAPLYLEQLGKHETATLFDRNDLEFLSTIPEDLESIADLLSVVSDVLPGQMTRLASLAHLLSCTAQAQAMIAETLVEAFGEESSEIAETIEELVQEPVKESIPVADNVIPFRRR